MIKECVILNGQIINIGPWNYLMQPFLTEPEQLDAEGHVIKEAVYEDRPTNPFPDGAAIEQRDFEHNEDRGWFEVGTAATPTQTEQIATLKSKLAATEQAAADNSLTTQQLLESLIDKGVI